jgi:heme/copper-type cytochrome/quinol oxidase subunit 2
MLEERKFIFVDMMAASFIGTLAAACVIYLVFKYDRMDRAGEKPPIRLLNWPVVLLLSSAGWLIYRF